MAAIKREETASRVSQLAKGKPKGFAVTALQRLTSDSERDIHDLATEYEGSQVVRRFGGLSFCANAFPFKSI
jgi:hypothetical protein